LLRECPPCSRTTSNIRSPSIAVPFGIGDARLAVLRGQFGKLDVTEGRDQVMVNVAGVAGIGRRPNSWTGVIGFWLAFSSVITIVRQFVLEG